MESKCGKQNLIKLVLPDVIIDEDTASLYCKREKFHMLTSDNKIVGYLNLNINVVQSCDCFEFVVHTSSKFETVEIGECGMTMTSRVRPSLTTMEEKRHEYDCAQDIERDLYLAKLRKNYYISASVTDTKSSENDENRRGYRTPISELYNFISEAANLMILKFLALNRKTGKLKTRTLLMNGDICNSALIVCEEKLVLNKVTYDTTKVTRLIKGSTNSTIQKLETWLTDQGQILQHKWDNTELVMVFNSDHDMDTGYTPLEKSWQNDLQLASIYLDKLGKLKGTYATYLYDHPQAEQMFNDFIILLLMRKPEDVVEFAIDYFTSVGK